MNDRNGIYMPNLDYIPSKAQARFDTAKFQWAVVRSDSAPSIAQWCTRRGARVIMQLPDHFNHYPPMDPFHYARICLRALQPFEPFSIQVCLDNEPNLAAIHGGRWFAEEWTRWIRAVHANFRWLDKACHWQLVYPAICHPHTNLGQYWIETSIEPMRKCDYVGVHVYWPGHDDYQDGLAIRQIQAYLGRLDGSNILVLEYGDGDFLTPDATEADDYTDFVSTAPDQVKACCKFILSGTTEWEDFFLTDLQAERLGAIE